jgi:hypothetical protein
MDEVDDLGSVARAQVLAVFGQLREPLGLRTPIGYDLERAAQEPVSTQTLAKPLAAAFRAFSIEDEKPPICGGFS